MCAECIIARCYGVRASADVVRFLPFYSNYQVKGQQDTSLIKVTSLFNKTLS